MPAHASNAPSDRAQLSPSLPGAPQSIVRTFSAVSSDGIDRKIVVRDLDYLSRYTPGAVVEFLEAAKARKETEFLLEAARIEYLRVLACPELRSRLYQSIHAVPVEHSIVSDGSFARRHGKRSRSSLVCQGSDSEYGTPVLRDLRGVEAEESPSVKGLVQLPHLGWQRYEFPKKGNRVTGSGSERRPSPLFKTLKQFSRDFIRDMDDTVDRRTVALSPRRRALTQVLRFRCDKHGILKVGGPVSAALQRPTSICTSRPTQLLSDRMGNEEACGISSGIIEPHTDCLSPTNFVYDLLDSKPIRMALLQTLNRKFGVSLGFPTKCSSPVISSPEPSEFACEPYIYDYFATDIVLGRVPMVFDQDGAKRDIAGSLHNDDCDPTSRATYESDLCTSDLLTPGLILSAAGSKTPDPPTSVAPRHIPSGSPINVNKHPVQKGMESVCSRARYDAVLDQSPFDCNCSGQQNRLLRAYVGTDGFVNPSIVDIAYASASALTAGQTSVLKTGQRTPLLKRVSRGAANHTLRSRFSSSLEQYASSGYTTTISPDRAVHSSSHASTYTLPRVSWSRLASQPRRTTSPGTSLRVFAEKQRGPSPSGYGVRTACGIAMLQDHAKRSPFHLTLTPNIRSKPHDSPMMITPALRSPTAAPLSSCSLRAKYGAMDKH